MAKKKRTCDMHNADIRAELMKRGLSLARLGEMNGLAKTTLRNALDKPYPKGERIIARAIGKTPQEIWPSRYESRGDLWKY
ncbi:helix-turn-helix transcriptional regulator [Pasteurella skyensis]|uniref:Helix-turn-helix transcriptional regulator n=1 Tax=Phocoenobacter skyensis TaxID=97481 RepID=A0AAJ6NEP6_9PAST|nr:helix-turn-helix transcriptional regulator [Pasteurella skyensis]MDP8171513.1 helix-turn-helix transcriptional regulator [Pasteurella skyensis]MDP8175415.1 helix-turn-helix transcriptional regulator [Pasteurella skyensis]